MKPDTLNYISHTPSLSQSATNSALYASIIWSMESNLSPFGAINVAAIETVWSGLVTPPHRNRVETIDHTSSAIELARGAEMGRFNMGSTVILLFGENGAQWDETLAAEQAVRMGQALGTGSGTD